MTLEELNQKMKTCMRCRLAQFRKQVVPGEGNPHADILFIGEGPGAKEDERGIPFCGAAGKFLDELLASISLERKDVFIGNMVKCRPLDNRDPLQDEIDTCKVWLDKQIELINPKVICVLGRHSMAKFIPNQKISQIHGKVFRQKGTSRFVIAFYHPAVALYNGGMRPTLLEDFKTLKKVVDGKIKLGEEKQEIIPEIEFKQNPLL